jgi:FRG domain
VRFTARSPDVLVQALSRIGTLNSSRRFVWRGAADYRWHLASSLIRTQPAVPPVTELSIRGFERAAIREARAWGIGRELGASATDLHVLALLQHHGVRTRLLDVTSNPMTALYFACQPPSDPEVAGVLFAFDVTDVETYSTIDDVDAPSCGALQTPRQWTLRHALARSAKRQQPFLVVPALPDSRMLAQEGLFITSAVPEHSMFDQVDGLMLTSSTPVGR